jgi:DNA-binding transcriptional MocR family regulator
MIFEDDYDSEYCYSGRPIPALQGLDSSGLVLHTGSFSKVLVPALRLGYVVVLSGLFGRLRSDSVIDLSARASARATRAL